jgi:hypothetical protein
MKQDPPAEKNKNKRRYPVYWNYQLIIAVLLSVGGLVLLFLGFWCSPTGEIHHSVLIGFGEVSTFAGALFGVDYSYKYKHKNHPGD